jgi:hypothetical protein
MDSLCPSGLHKSLRNPKEYKSTTGPLDERVGRSLGALARERRRAGYVGIDYTRRGATKGSSGSAHDRRLVGVTAAKLSLELGGQETVCRDRVDSTLSCRWPRRPGCW